MGLPVSYNRAWWLLVVLKGWGIYKQNLGFLSLEEIMHNATLSRSDHKAKERAKETAYKFRSLQEL